MRNTPKPRGIDQIVPPPITPHSSFFVKGDIASVELTSQKRIRTVEELIEELKIDTKVWDVAEFKCSKQEVGSKYRDQNLKFTDGVMDGHAVRKNEWTVVTLWHVNAKFRRKAEEIAIREIGREIIEEMKRFSPTVKKFHYKKYSDPCLVEVDFFDLHLGKLAWGKETGEDFDLKIAKKRYMDCLIDMMNKVEPYNVEKFLFPVGNDYFNVNSSAATTFAGTPQSEDDRWKKTFNEGWKLIAEAIRILSQKAPVDVVVVPGNHDVESAFYMGEVLHALFMNDSNVDVDNSPPVRKYYRYGNNLIGFTHGKDEKIAELPLIMATERKKDWQETTYREWHLGDKHHKKDYNSMSTNEQKGVVVRLLRSLTSTDAWHSSKGYIGAVKAGEAFVWNKDQGLICNLSVNL